VVIFTEDYIPGADFDVVGELEQGSTIDILQSFDVTEGDSRRRSVGLGTATSSSTTSTPTPVSSRSSSSRRRSN